MIIGLVLPSLPGYSETFFRNKILGLQQNNSKVVLFVNDTKAEDKFLNCKVVKAPKLSGNKLVFSSNILLQLLKTVILNPKRSWRLYQLNKKDKLSTFQNVKQILANQFLLSHKLDWMHFGFGTMALGRENVAQAIGAKMAVSFRGYDHYVYPVKNKGCYKLLFTKEVKYHVLSQGMKKSLINSGIAPEKVKKIAPAINVDLFSNHKTQINHSELQILTVARLHWIKGLDYTLQALSYLREKGITFHYTIVGEGSEREHLMFAVYQLGLANYVTFTGKLAAEEIKQQLQETDLYIQYSNQEGFCNAVLEAQSMGKLCIVSDAEGLSENVIHQVTGFVVEKRKPELLANAISKIIDMDSESKEVIKKAAAERVTKEFRIEKQREAFVSFYNFV